MGPIDRPEPSVRSYHYSLRNNPEERRSHLGHCFVVVWYAVNRRKFCALYLLFTQYGHYTVGQTGTKSTLDTGI